MSLRTLRLRNFRCFQEAALDNCPRLLVLIGENDSGKTTFLDAIEILLGERKASRQDFRALPAGDTIVDDTSIEIEARFHLGSGHGVPLRCTAHASESELRIRRRISAADLKTEVHVFGRRFIDERFESFGKNAGADRDALASLGLDPGKNQAERLIQCERRLENVGI